MDIGIFAKTFPRPTLDATLAAVAAQDIRYVQFNLSCAGLPTLPATLSAEQCDQIRAALHRHGLHMAAISGTYNMIHPDPAVRADGLGRLAVLAAACPALGTQVITLCTGTRDAQDMWRRHPDNDSPTAWADLLDAMRQAAAIAARYNVTLGVEPEVSNVVDSAAKARALLDAVGSPHVKIVLDGANLFHTGELAHMHAVLDEAFALLGNDLVLAHAKDLAQDGAAGSQAAGTGVLDYDYYLSGLQRCGYRGPLILHALAEGQVRTAVAFLRAKLAAAGAAQEWNAQ